MAPAPSDPAPTAARRARAVASVAAALAIIVGVLGLAGVGVVRRHLLDPGTYRDALVRAEAYDRIYTDVLADPELSRAKEDLLGDLELRALDPATARIVGTNSLRLVLPPSAIRSSAEEIIRALVAYLRGDTDRLELRIDLSGVLAHLDEVARTNARLAVASAHAVPAQTIERYRSEVDELLDEVAAGRLPARIPVAAADLDDGLVMQVLDEVAGSSPTRRLAVDGAVLAGRDRDALAAAMEPALAAHTRAAAAALRAGLVGRTTFDIVGQLAHHTGARQAEVLEHLAVARGAISHLTTLALGASIVLVVAGTVALWALHRGDLRRAANLVAASFLAAGLAAVVGWTIVRHGVEPPLHPATSSGPGSWDLPPGLRRVIADVEGNLTASLQSAITRVALVPLAAGLALASLANAGRLVAHRRPLLAVAAAASLVLAADAFLPTSRARTCNGLAALCERRYDQVVQVATHNAMSHPGAVQFWPEQDSTMHEQLDSGVRALLIDTHHWTAVSSPEQLAHLVPGMPTELLELSIAAEPERLRARPGAFLCHVHCAFGGQPLGDGLEEIRSFLAANPDAVVTLIVQDAISPAETKTAFERAGLGPYLYRDDPAGGWPTLGEMIDRGERLVVFAENQGSRRGWYRQAFTAMQDTPFGFPSEHEMTCERHRGPADAPLFLMNHWVSSVAPDRATAARVNRRATIVERARRCASERGRLPTFIAVDFSDVGDVTGAVSDLNELPS